MYEATLEAKYQRKIEELGEYYLNEAQRTPGGMLFFGEWASAPNAAAAAFTLLVVQYNNSNDWRRKKCKQYDNEATDHRLTILGLVLARRMLTWRPSKSTTFLATILLE
jgi:hypothetical protein